KAVTYDSVPVGDSRATAGIISEIIMKEDGHVFIIPFNSTGKNIAGQVAVMCKAGVATSVSGLPLSTNPIVVPVTVFAGKATADVRIDGERAVLAIQSNSIEPEESPSNAIEVETYGGDKVVQIKIVERKTV